MIEVTYAKMNLYLVKKRFILRMMSVQRYSCQLAVCHCAIGAVVCSAVSEVRIRVAMVNVRVIT